MKWTFAIFAGVVVLSAPLLAVAHVELIDPPNRYGQFTQKQAPCGQGDGPRSDRVSVYESGQTIAVSWKEFVDHPGHFRVAFDADGQDDLVDPVCLSGCDTRQPTIETYSNEAVLLDDITDQSGGVYEVEVELPDVTCDNCTLQVIQVMYDKPPYELPGNDLYYNCADLELRAGSSADAGDAGSGDAGSDDAGSDDAGTGDAGTEDAGAGDAGTDDAGSGDAGTDDAGSGDASGATLEKPSDAGSGGCVTAGPGEYPPPLGALALCVLLVRLGWRGPIPTGSP
jgi:hypothetical protein